MTKTSKTKKTHLKKLLAIILSFAFVFAVGGSLSSCSIGQRIDFTVRENAFSFRTLFDITGEPIQEIITSFESMNYLMQSYNLVINHTHYEYMFFINNAMIFLLFHKTSHTDIRNLRIINGVLEINGRTSISCNSMLVEHRLIIEISQADARNINTIEINSRGAFEC